MKTPQDSYQVYTDGSAHNRLKSGGWGFVILDHNERPIQCGYSGNVIEEVTSNMMEMEAATQAVLALHRLKIQNHAKIHCDSQYVVRGMNEWRHGWERNGWRSTSGMVSNRPLWKRLIALHNSYPGRASWHWVRGHNGHTWNELVDKLAAYRKTSEQKKELALAAGFPPP